MAASAVDIERAQRARMRALEQTFLWRALAP